MRSIDGRQSSPLCLPASARVPVCRDRPLFPFRAGSTTDSTLRFAPVDSILLWLGSMVNISNLNLNTAKLLG
jgi:hypothetical protein